MNSYQVCLSVLALCFCLAGAVTRNDLERLIHQTNAEVRVHDTIAIKNATRDALLRATSPLQRVCVVSKQGPAYRELNLALNQELVAVETEYRTEAPAVIEALDAVDLALVLLERNNKASTAQNWIDQINQC